MQKISHSGTAASLSQLVDIREDGVLVVTEHGLLDPGFQGLLYLNVVSRGGGKVSLPSRLLCLKSSGVRIVGGEGAALVHC